MFASTFLSLTRGMEITKASLEQCPITCEVAWKYEYVEPQVFNVTLHAAKHV